MAVSSGFAKMETLLLNSSSSSAASPASVRAYLGSPLQVSLPDRIARRMPLRGGGVVRCEAVDTELNDMSAKVSSRSTMEQLRAGLSDRYTKEKSSIVVIGLSIHTASVEMREKLAIPEAEWPRAIPELCGLNHIEEAAVLSTCNRLEIYVVALSQHRGVKEVTEWMSLLHSSSSCLHFTSYFSIF